MCFIISRQNTCIFISGAGSNLRSIINSSRDVNFPIKVSLILCNNSRAFGIKYAKKFKTLDKLREEVYLKKQSEKNKARNKNKAKCQTKHKHAVRGRNTRPVRKQPMRHAKTRQPCKDSRTLPSSPTATSFSPK